jgi:hypothetical protein
MVKVLIGVGGTGAKILESFAYLSVMGLPGMQLPENESYHLRMIDTDKENGNLERTRHLLSVLGSKGSEDGGVISLFDNLSVYNKQIQKHKEWAVSPVNHELIDKNRNSSPFLWKIDLTRIDSLKSMANELNKVNDRSKKNHLINALYSKHDLEVNQSEGFHARPRIGAIRFEYEYDKDIASDNGFWNTLNNAVFKARETQLMFAGSIFGGTGASGIPTLLKKCQESFFKGDPESSLGMTLMLPYYSFDTLQGNYTEDTVKDLADPKQFLLNSKLALAYYCDTEFLNDISNPSVYVIGQDPQTPMVNGDKSFISLAAGKKDQINPALPAELTAALAVSHYFSNKTDSNVVKLCDTGPNRQDDDGNINFEDEIPDHKNVMTALNRLGMFCILWKIISKRRPSKSLNFDFIPFRDLADLKNSQSDKFNDLLSNIDAFILLASNYLLELDANGINLKWFREKHDEISNFLNKEKSFNNSSILLFNKKINFWFWHILKTTNSFRKISNDNKNYYQILYGVMKACCDACPFYSH